MRSRHWSRQAGDLMLRAATLVKTDEEFEVYNTAMEKWNNKAEAGNIMANVSRCAGAVGS